MGWLDCHLHQVHVTNPSGDEHRVGILDDSGWGEPTAPGWKRKLSPVSRRPGDAALYTHDFGDGWEHAGVLKARTSVLPHVWGSLAESKPCYNLRTRRLRLCANGFVL